MRQSLVVIRKIGEVTALLFSTIAIASSASAASLTIGNTSVDNNFSTRAGIGQSFINDPLGTGAAINLNTWTSDFLDSSNQSTAALSTLTIYNGTGSGGSLVGTSTSTSTAAVNGYTNPVTWTFIGGLPIIDTSTYTAVSVPFLRTLISTNNPYPDGVLTSGASFSNPQFDIVFRGTFSVTPVPFEFNPALGLVGLGALWLVKEKLVKKKK